MGLQLLCLAVCTAMLAGVSYAASLRICVGRARIDLASAIVVHMATTMSLVLCVALVGELSPLGLLAGTAVLTLLSAVTWRLTSAEAKAQALRHARAHRRQLLALVPGPGPWKRLGYALVVSMLAAHLIRVVAHVWLLPPYVWDVWTYHLPRVAEWVRAEGLVTMQTPVLRVHWPANFELLQAWFAVFPRHDVVVELAGIPAYVGCCLCVYAIVRALGAGRPLSVLTTVLFAHTPIVLLSATSCKNDILITFVYLLMVALAVDFRSRPGVGAGPYLLSAVVALAMAIGTKATIAFATSGIALLAIWAYRGRSDLPPPTPSTLTRAVRTFTRDNAGLVVFVGVLSLPLAGFWYARNWVQFDNPFHPTDLHLFGALVFGSGEGHGQQGGFSLHSLTESTSAILGERVLDRAGRMSVEAGDMLSWGWFAFSCGPPALLVALAVRREMRWIAGAFTLSLASMLAWVSPDPWVGKFISWFPALFALAFASCFSWLRGGPWRAALVGLAVVTTALNFLATIDTGLLSPSQWARMADLPVQHRIAPALRAHNGRWYDESLSAVPEGETLGYHVDENGWLYPLYGRGFGRAIRFVPIEGGTDVAEAMGELRYLFVPKATGAVAHALARAVERGRLRERPRGVYVKAD